MVRLPQIPRMDRLSVRTQIALLAASLVLASAMVGTIVVALYALQSVEQQLGHRALHVANTVAQIDEIQRSIGEPGGQQAIQRLAERVRLVNDVDYVVVLDMEGRRLSHPVPARIGTRFEGGDEGPAFAEHSYVSLARGTRGNSVRAFVPVMSDAQRAQVGVVVVGLLTPSVVSILSDIRPSLLLALAATMLVGYSGAWLLGGRIKRQLMGLEPPEIARLMQERLAILDAIGEGVLAIDRDQRITVLNHVARRIIGTDSSLVGTPLTLVVPHSRLPEILRSGESELNREMLLGHTVVLTNRVPIRVDGQIIGAVATFRDRTEVHRLAEQLTGVTAFVDSLRAQNHEHMNRLHTIAGLVQLGRYDQAVDYAFSNYEEQQEQTQFLTRRFHDYRIAGLLLGKLHRAREMGIALQIDPDSHLGEIPESMGVSTVVVLVGNLLENAMEAVATGPPKRRQVFCHIGDQSDGLKIQVRDTGPGIAPEVKARMWESGFSTKPGSNRGVGLALVRQHVQSSGGRIAAETGPEGTCFTIWLPFPEVDAEGVDTA